MSATKASFQAVKKPSGGLGPYQIECNISGEFQPCLIGLLKETMEDQLSKLVERGHTVVPNEHFTPKPVKSPK